MTCTLSCLSSERNYGASCITFSLFQLNLGFKHVLRDSKCTCTLPCCSAAQYKSAYITMQPFMCSCKMQNGCMVYCMFWCIIISGIYIIIALRESNLSSPTGEACPMMLVLFTLHVYVHYAGLYINTHSLANSSSILYHRYLILNGSNSRWKVLGWNF